MRQGNADIFVMDADGSNVQQLTYDDRADWDPAWSPDGAFIAYQSFEESGFALFIMRADGSDRARLTDHALNEWAPDWGP
jgi:TolB protein